jgi:hypothetical protein
MFIVFLLSDAWKIVDEAIIHLSPDTRLIVNGVLLVVQTLAVLVALKIGYSIVKHKIAKSSDQSVKST